jgi:hypothetical protein
LIAKGAGNNVLTTSADNIVTPNTPVVVAASYANGVAGNDGNIRVTGTNVAGSETVNSPNPAIDPQARFGIGAANGTSLPLNGRIYALAILRGPDARADVVNYEAVI